MEPTRGKSSLSFVWIAGLALLAAGSAEACPLCHSSRAEEVRAGIRATAQSAALWLGLLVPFTAAGIALTGASRRDDIIEEDA